LSISRVIRAFIVCASIFITTSAVAQNQQLVSNVFFNTDLRQALEDVAAQAGVNIITDPSVQGVVSVELTDVTVEKALELLLAGTEFQVQRTADYFLVFTADQRTDMFQRVANTQIYQTEFVAAETARSLLPDSLQRYVRVNSVANTLAVTAPPEILQRVLSDLREIDVPSREQTTFIPLTHVRAATAQTLLPATLQRYVRVDEQRQTLAITAPRTALVQILDYIREIDVARRPGTQNYPDLAPTRVIKLSHASAATAVNLLPQAIQEYVRADEDSNTIAISAPEPMMSSILADVATIDIPRKHVMLDARIVVLERGDLLDFGADWKAPRVTAGTVLGDVASSLTGMPWQLSIGYTPGREFTNALSLTLNMLTQNDEATIIASPQVLAQDGRTAEIKVTTEEWFQITADAGGVFVRSQLQEIQTGTILSITPRIGRNGNISLDMQIEVSDVIARGASNLPVVSRRIATSTVEIESGGTAAVAGLVDTRSQLSKGGVPGLANLPLLGNAFRTDKLNHQARQVAVFITATLVDGKDGSMGKSTRQAPPIAMVNEAVYRNELEAALIQLGAGAR
jgi:type II secretory pathway component GspD/PulD (secretin)